MTLQEKIVLGALVLAGAGLVIWQGSQGTEGGGAVQGAVEGVTWKAGYPQGHEHLALPWDIGTVIWGPHPLYCDPYGPGRFRDPLIAEGWSDWIANNPSDETI